MKTFIVYCPSNFSETNAPESAIELLARKTAKGEFWLAIPEITLPVGAVFDYTTKKHGSFIAFRITEIRYDPFEGVLTYWVDYDQTDLSDEEWVDELITVWTEPVR